MQSYCYLDSLNAIEPRVVPLVFFECRSTAGRLLSPLSLPREPAKQTRFTSTRQPKYNRQGESKDSKPGEEETKPLKNEHKTRNGERRY